MVHAYLGMDDSKLPVPIPGLVPRDALSRYVTNFRSVDAKSLDFLSARGEQLIGALIKFYCPDL